jgi:hypothetical protein
MSQNKGDLNMSNFHIGDTVRVGKTGKVEYQVINITDEGVHVSSGKSNRTVPSDNLTLVKAATNVSVEDVVATQDVDVERAYWEEINNTNPGLLSDSKRAELNGTATEDTFDPRQDRRQSAYGLSILAQVLRKGANNPRQFGHNSNPLKPITSKRAKVRNRIKAQRATANALHREYNAMVREQGYKMGA